MNSIARAFRILGTTDEVDACDCCGKTGLKSTVAVVELDADGNELTGDTLYFGCTCAARAARREVKDVRRDAAAEDRAREEAERLARAERARRSHAAWVAHLVARTGGIYSWDGKPDVFVMIRSLGGHAAAAVGFVEPA